MICGVSRPTKILIYVAKIRLITIQVRKITPNLRVRLIIVRIIERNKSVEVSPKYDKTSIVVFKVLFTWFNPIFDRTKSSKSEVSPTNTNTVRPPKIDTIRIKKGDRTLVLPMYATGMLDNRKCGIG
jgi:hypothetical protein